MIITTEQQENLKHLLNENIKYLETYNEVYDHVVTALETDLDSTLSFDNKVQAILHNDFGGLIQLRGLERQRARSVNNQIAKKQLKYAGAYFKFPLIVYSALAAVLVYYLANTKLLSVVLLVAIYLMLTPTILVGIKAIKRAFSKKTQKPSIKTGMFNQMAIYGVVLYNVINPTLISGHFNLHVHNQWKVFTMVVTVLFYVIYGLSFIKLYRQEVKMQVAS